ncbi:hypothetical protein DYB37_009803 [Aphanomyces astaci]|uniref:Uncharacterized protein n=1 Tax=Aphanomyces astaci TaxID=112090 RepID=A0A397AUV0_APHAT|nr:hypothetical protein DYB25_005353 [Aphanomyces astaci]RHY56665.1 hypothetical protein DYB38_005064 [Aphanomyces astaci]RHY88632.1 hypothetical protein DYB35_008751 [Aphanomyces astaci]RHZ17616.1 hypothetical protein DYB37_009803 [Aphanomyces astaci]RHZ40694.1 hypothetical protein DYB26_009435 [Aphanomyces astaci]
MALFRAAQKHMDIMNTDLVVSDDGDDDSSGVSGDEGEDSDEDAVHQRRRRAASDSDDDGDRPRKEVDADDDSDDAEAEVDEEEERAAFLDDFVPTTLEGRNAFRCKVCPQVKLFNEQDILNHKHKRACITPEEIARLKARNQRKSAKRRLKHQTALDAKKALANKAKDNSSSNNENKTHKTSAKRTKPTADAPASTEERVPKKAKKSSAKA